MGGSESKDQQSQQGDRESNEFINHPKIYTEKSSGFHIFELHVPLMGLGLIMIIIIIMAVFFLLKHLRKRALSAHRRRHLEAFYQHQLGGYGPLGSMAYPDAPRGEQLEMLPMGRSLWQPLPPFPPFPPRYVAALPSAPRIVDIEDSPDGSPRRKTISPQDC